MKKILKVKNLYISYSTNEGDVKALRGIDFEVYSGEVLGIVGETGSGKTTAVMSIVKMLAENAKVKKNGEIIFNNSNIVDLTEEEMQTIRGNEISIMFKESGNALNPFLTVESQLIEHVIQHKKIDKIQAINDAIDMLKLIGVNNAEEIMKKYPDKLQRGVRQKILIASSLMCEPEIIIADELTTFLDISIRAQILELIDGIRSGVDSSLILTTSNLGSVVDLCDRIHIMYGGLIVEKGNDDDIFYRSRHPYTWGLIKSIPNYNVSKGLVTMEGEPPDLIDPPVGCPFAARCEHAMRICKRALPPLFRISDRHEAACFLNHPEAPNIKSSIGKRRIK